MFLFIKVKNLIDFGIFHLNKIRFCSIEKKFMSFIEKSIIVIGIIITYLSYYLITWK
jgi:hypothetical protein